MARPYSEKFLLDLYRSNAAPSLGIELGKACVKYNLPAAYVAVALEVSKVTMYKWFRGREVREKNAKRVQVFMDLAKQDFETGILPAKSVDDARIYIQNLTGVTI